MDTFRNKLVGMALAFAALDPTLSKSTSTNYYYGNDRTRVIDNVVSELVNTGRSDISRTMFDDIKYTLPKKMRGQVLFHCDIITKQIFVTYTKSK